MTPPLVLLHAFPLDSRMFDPVRSGAGRQGAGLLTPDLRGFGSGPALGDPLPEPDLGAAGRRRGRRAGRRGHRPGDRRRGVHGRVRRAGGAAPAPRAGRRAGAGRHPQRRRRRRRAGAAPGGGGAGGRRGHRRRRRCRRPADRRRHRRPRCGIARRDRGGRAGGDRRLGAAGDGRPAGFDGGAGGADVPVLVVVGEQDAVTPPAAASADGRSGAGGRTGRAARSGAPDPGRGPGRVRRRRSRVGWAVGSETLSGRPCGRVLPWG